MQQAIAVFRRLQGSAERLTLIAALILMGIILLFSAGAGRLLYLIGRLFLTMAGLLGAISSF